MLAKSTLMRLLIAAGFLLFANILFAQKTVTGIVTDDNGQPVVGATVAAKGSSAATQTNSEGKFSITVPNGAKTLAVTSIGFTSQELAIGNQGNVSVSLVASANKLSEVVVTALGVNRQKKALQYSV